MQNRTNPDQFIQAAIDKDNQNQIVMRMIRKRKPMPKVGELRTATWFALFPVKLYDEIRWLETVSVEQMFTEHFHGFEDGNSHSWDNIRFVDKPDKAKQQ